MFNYRRCVMSKYSDKEMDERFGYGDLNNDDSYEKLVEICVYLEQIASDSSTIRWTLQIIGVLLMILIWRFW